MMLVAMKKILNKLDSWNMCVRVCVCACVWKRNWNVELMTKIIHSEAKAEKSNTSKKRISTEQKSIY